MISNTHYGKLLMTALLVAVAAALVALKYWHFLANPWTRDGMVRAIVVQVTPRVSGPITDLPIKDNQKVSAGDLLFHIDPRTFQANFDEAQAELVRTKEDYERGLNLVKKGDISKRDFDAALAAYDVAKADLDSAKLDLEFTEVKASVDGYVTNLTLRKGSQAVTNQPALALIDTNSFWVHGYFREDYVADIKAGDKAIVTLMTYPDQPLTGAVDSIGWGIAQTDGSSGVDLLPSINPTFEWIRLAQRVPVRVHLDTLPQGVVLRVGTTASVLVKTGD
ncbi:MAG: HlyD family secretion protein [Halieaceae bacterium]